MNKTPQNLALIRFPDTTAKRRALAYLAGRFAFKSWASGQMLVSEMALAELTHESIHFSVEDLNNLPDQRRS